MISKIGDIDEFYDNIVKVNDDNILWNELSKNGRILYDKLISFKNFRKSIKRYF